MSIRKRNSRKAKKGFVYEVYFNYTNIYGIPSRYSKSGFITKKQAEDHETEKKNELLSNGIIRKNINLTLNQVFDEAVKRDFPNIYQENSIISYKNYYNRHVKNDIGNYLIIAIDYSIVQDFFNRKNECGQSLIDGIKKVLNATFVYAQKCGYIQTNYINLIKPKGKEVEAKKKVYTDKEFNTVLNDINAWNNEYSTPFIIALYVGKYTALRISEVFALDWTDIDFISNTINVNKKLVYKSNHLHISNTMKTSSSKAIIPLALPLKNILLEWNKIHNTIHVISDNNDNHIDPFKLQNKLREINKRRSISFTFHMLRHTYATQLYNGNVDIKTVQALLRHNNANTTLNVYTHINLAKLSNTVENIFNSESVEKVSKKEMIIN